jgi:DNA invertase Pin-like site-specific DNA recombinase
MSTEHQQYSIANQTDAIAAYALRHGLEVVRTYADEGKSGLTLRGRAGLSALLADVVGGRADFGTVLVYDVSRWGRFQDPDESAYYEFVCRREGVHIEYCMELFPNDGTATSSLIKSLKRMMAGEYSRELSRKVFIGKCRLARRGQLVGSRPGYGLRRLLLDSAGRSRGILHQGEAKFAITDRVVLVPGPAHEVAVVRWIFRQVAERGTAPQGHRPGTEPPRQTLEAGETVDQERRAAHAHQREVHRQPGVQQALDQAQDPDGAQPARGVDPGGGHLHARGRRGDVPAGSGGDEELDPSDRQ